MGVDGQKREREREREREEKRNEKRKVFAFPLLIAKPNELPNAFQTTVRERRHVACI